MRSLDGLNTHDDAYQLAISGGVTTANILPGSANAIGPASLSLLNKAYTYSRLRRPSVRYQTTPY